MAQIVQLACARCGHQQMVVVEAAEHDGAVAQGVHSTDADDTSTAEAERLGRLESLPRSLPVGGIITPV